MTQRTMTVIVNGKPEQRPVSHQQINEITRMWEDQPVAQPGEIIERTMNGDVIIIKGAHQ